MRIGARGADVTIYLQISPGKRDFSAKEKRRSEFPAFSVSALAKDRVPLATVLG